MSLLFRIWIKYALLPKSYRYNQNFQKKSRQLTTDLGFRRTARPSPLSVSNIPVLEHALRISEEKGEQKENIFPRKIGAKNMVKKEGGASTCEWNAFGSD